MISILYVHLYVYASIEGNPGCIHTFIQDGEVGQMTKSLAYVWAVLPLFLVISVGLWKLIPGVGFGVGAIWLAMFLFEHLSERR